MIYDLVLSKGSVIKIDDDDLETIKKDISAQFIKIKQGIFNPSFMVMIAPTMEPDVMKIPIIDNSGPTALITGEMETKKLADLMSGETKRLK